MLGPENAPNKTRECRLRVGGGLEGTAEGAGGRRVPGRDEPPRGPGGCTRHEDAGNVTPV